MLRTFALVSQIVIIMPGGCRYDPQFNNWSKISAMNSRRLGVGVAVLAGFLYAVGGSDGQSPLNTGTCVHRFVTGMHFCETIWE